MSELLNQVRLCFSLNGRVELDEEYSPLRGNRFYPDDPAVLFDNFLANSQTKTNASFFGCVEGLENVFNFFFAYSASGITYGYADCSFSAGFNIGCAKS